MGIYDRLINLYVNSEDSDLDRQIVAECKCDSVCSIDKVVRQFKFLTNNMHDKFLTVMMNCGADDHSVEELREVSNWQF